MVMTRFQARGGAALRERLQTVSARMSADEWAPGMHLFLLALQRERFETEGRSEDAPWPALEVQEPLWAALKRRLGADPRALRWMPGRKERLFPSLTQVHDADHRYDVRADEVLMSSTLPYAATMDQGGTNPFGETIPARPLGHMGRSSRERLGRLFKDFVIRDDMSARDWEQPR